MDFVRSSFDAFYEWMKPRVFKKTEDDPKRAHELFSRFCKALHAVRLEKLVLNNSANKLRPPFELSNAAGFNKNGDLPPTVLHHLGFDRVVVGTVTYDPWSGNPRPTIRRYEDTESLVNWEGLPGIGAQAVAENLARFGDHDVPITINLMSTPQKKGDELLRDLEATVQATKDLPYVDRYELNISCPNTHGADGSRDARAENLAMLEHMICVVRGNSRFTQDIYLKVSPDSSEADVNDTVTVAKNVANSKRIKGVVTTNTTTNHDRRYIPESPTIEGEQVGGASGDAVYEAALRVQRLYNKEIEAQELDWNIIACGGINSKGRVSERRTTKTTGIQIYTPIIFKGPKLVRELRTYKA